MRRKPKLYLCGMGHFPPYTTSLNVLHALAGCDRVVAVGADEGLRGVLRDFGAGGGQVVHYPEARSRAARERALREVRRGRTVGLVRAGRYLPFDGEASALAAYCRKAGIDWEAFGAVSPMGLMLARLNQTLGVDMHGLQAYGWQALIKGGVANPRQPLVVLFTGRRSGPQGAQRLRRALERAYPRDHHCWMFGPGHDAAPEPFRLGDLAARFPAIDPARFIHVPAL